MCARTHVCACESERAREREKGGECGCGGVWGWVGGCLIPPLCSWQGLRASQQPRCELGPQRQQPEAAARDTGRHCSVQGLRYPGLRLTPEHQRPPAPRPPGVPSARRPRASVAGQAQKPASHTPRVRLENLESEADGVIREADSGGGGSTGTKELVTRAPRTQASDPGRLGGWRLRGLRL